MSAADPNREGPDCLEAHVKRHETFVLPGTTAGELIAGHDGEPDEFEFLIGSPSTLVGDTNPHQLDAEQTERLQTLLKQHGLDKPET